MNTIERVKEKLNWYHKMYADDFDELTGLGTYEQQVLQILDSLAAERCVWRVVTFHGDDQWQACDDNWLFVKDLPKDTVKGFMLCPYCGKRIEVKEV